MNKRTKATDYRGILLLGLFVLGLVGALIVSPYQFQSKAGSKKSNWRTESFEPGYENYDIRTDKSDAADQFLTASRQISGLTESLVENHRKGFVQGEEQLRASVPTLKVEYNEDIRIPEVIAPDVNRGFATLTGPSSGIKNAEILRNFIRQNNSLIGVDDLQANKLKVTADYTNPDGNLSYAHLEQFINDVPVFRGEIKAGFNKRGEMFRVINNLAPNLDYNSLSGEFGDPVDAVKAAFTKVTRPIAADDTMRNEAVSDDLRVVFGSGDWPTMAEKIYFPTEPGVAVPAWKVIIWQKVNSYNVIVDAKTGTMLWRKNMANDQTQSATYQVYVSPTAMVNVAGNPAPMSPGPVDPTLGQQGAIIARTNVTLIGNEPPYAFNNLGWVTDGNNTTDGNNLEAGLDLNGDNVIDPGSQSPGVPNRTFTSLWNPPPGSPAPGDAPTAAEARRGAVIQMFYAMNRYHDEMYLLGFTEAARNFQNDNFGRNPGGANANAIAGVDRVSAEGQDSSGTNNANFNTQADGIRGRMQMFVWTGPSPQRDGTGDAEVIFHEVTHGTSNRLHNNAAGLTTNMSQGMGEGWSDFYGHVLLSRSTEPLDSINATGGYALLNGFGVVGNRNYYYGIRRFPKARMSFTGGPMNRPHNPMTFADIDSTQINVSDGAYAAMSGPHISTTPDQLHAAGEIWSSALWEVRCLFVARLGWAVGNRKALQLVTDGMKLDPNGPTFLQARDSIITAAQNSVLGPEAGIDVADVREGFRIRGMGFSASIQTATSPARVTQAFDAPNALIVDPFAVSDSTGDNDGFPEPGEPLLLTVNITNTSGTTITNVIGSVTGGGSANYGDIANGATVSRQISYTVPAGAACGSLHQVTLMGTSTAGALNPVNRSFRLGVPVGGPPVTFTNSTPLTIPATGTGPGVTAPYGTTIAVSGLTGNKNVKVELTGITHTFPGDLDFLLVGPGGQKYIVLSDAGNTTDLVNGTVTLTDLAATVITTSGDINIAGEWKPTNFTAGDTFDAPAPVGPYLSAAPVGTDTLTSSFGAAAAGLNGTWTLYVRDDASIDSGTMAGWKLTFEANDYNCFVGPAVANSDARADFDGDSKSDLAVYRPNEGNWYLNRSTAGFTVVKWGLSSDTLVPGDYDGDDKTDTAVFRASNTAGVPDFFVLRSSNSTVFGIEFGLQNDVPVVGDFNGGDLDDFAVYRQSTGHWYTYANPAQPTGPDGSIVTITFVGTTGTPVSGDFDGDDISDLTMYEAGVWTIRKSTGGTVMVNWGGQAGDKLVPADYDGDGKDDQAVFRNGQWLIHGSLGVDTTVNWGVNTDIPVPGNYDGDNKEDVAVYRNGIWYVNGSTSGIVISNFGLGGDSAIERAYQQP